MYSSMQEARPHLFLFTYLPSPIASWERVSPLFNPAATAHLGCLQLLPGSQSFLLTTRKCPCQGTAVRASRCLFIYGSSVALQCIMVFSWCHVQGLSHCHAACGIFFMFMLYAGFMLYSGSFLLSCRVRGPSLPCCVQIFFIVIASIPPATHPARLLASQCVSPKSLHLSSLITGTPPLSEYFLIIHQPQIHHSAFKCYPILSWT